MLYLVLGDNCNNSYDSRSRLVGFVPYRLIEGRAVWRYWPLQAPAGFGTALVCPDQIRDKLQTWFRVCISSLPYEY